MLEIRKQRAAQRLHEIEQQRVQIIDQIRMRADDVALGNNDPYALKLTKKATQLSPLRTKENKDGFDHTLAGSYMQKLMSG